MISKEVPSTKTIYQCEYCKTESDSKTEIQKCEDKHKVCKHGDFIYSYKKYSSFKHNCDNPVAEVCVIKTCGRCTSSMFPLVQIQYAKSKQLEQIYELLYEPYEP